MVNEDDSFINVAVTELGFVTYIASTIVAWAVGIASVGGVIFFTGWHVGLPLGDLLEALIAGYDARRGDRTFARIVGSFLTFLCCVFMTCVQLGEWHPRGPVFHVLVGVVEGILVMALISGFVLVVRSVLDRVGFAPAVETKPTAKTS